MPDTYLSEIEPPQEGYTHMTVRVRDRETRSYLGVLLIVPGASARQIVADFARLADQGAFDGDAPAPHVYIEIPIGEESEVSDA